MRDLTRKLVCISSCGRIELPMNIKDILLISGSGEQSENVANVIENDIIIKRLLSIYSAELKKSVVSEYCSDVDDNDIDSYLVWLLAGDANDQEYVIYREENEKYYDITDKSFSSVCSTFILSDLTDDTVIPEGYEMQVAIYSI